MLRVALDSRHEHIGEAMKKRRAGKIDVLGGLERFLLAIMGPPQVGDLDAPVREVPAGPVDICPRCGQPQDEHEVIRSPELTYMQCPKEPQG
jgi:hypothetical protein